MHHVLDEHSVIVLGAGATRAFLPAAPLAEDDYNLKHLSDQFRGFPYAYRLLESERHRRSNGTINIEQLMTRLQGRMPYDSSDATAQQSLLLSELMREFIRKITFARQKELHKDELAAFAKVCVNKSVTCITFNYDDVLDQALWEVNPIHSGNPHHTQPKHWHPDGGYGFFIRPSSLAVQDKPQYMDTTSMLLLKLHGSINWYPRKGERPPYTINALHHDEDWFGLDSHMIPIAQATVARHFESDPLIIPPVLDKTALSNEPVLQVVWSLAKDALSRASQVFFVGYSMPVTDMAAGFLFNESLEGNSHFIRVINLATKEENKEQTRSAYRKLFPKLKDDQFEFEGALKWVQEVSAEVGDRGA
jgi:hypothetical protein